MASCRMFRGLFPVWHCVLILYVRRKPPLQLDAPKIYTFHHTLEPYYTQIHRSPLFPHTVVPHGNPKGKESESVSVASAKVTKISLFLLLDDGLELPFLVYRKEIMNALTLTRACHSSSLRPRAKERLRWHYSSFEKPCVGVCEIFSDT